MEDFTKQDEAYRAYQKGFADGVKSVPDNNVWDKQTREKLIEIIAAGVPRHEPFLSKIFEGIADRLIANGVTVLSPDEARNIYTVQELEELQGEAYDLGVESVLHNHYGLSWHDAEKVRKEVSKLQSVSKWIPVTERLPEPETEVLVLAERKSYSFKTKSVATYHIVTTAMYEDGSKNTEDSGWFWETDGFEYDEELDAYIIPEGWWEYKHYNDDEHNHAIDDKVTHWMPLPEPPKGE